MTIALKQKIQEDVKTAMRTQEKARLATLRLLTAAIKQFEVDNRIEASDADTIGLLDKLAKQRRESIDIYDKANRQDLADKERYELELIVSYLPSPLNQAEIEALIKAALAETAASSIKDLGKVMNYLKPKLHGRADLSAVSAQLKQYLS